MVVKAVEWASPSEDQTGAPIVQVEAFGSVVPGESKRSI